MKTAFFPSRRGQVTIFIIVGIVILFTFAGILYLTKSSTEERLTAEGAPVISQVPQEFQPLQVYTENCLHQLGVRGLQILGQQGGYIYPEVLGEFSVSNPTDSVGLNLEPLKVPYWHYNREPNSAKVVRYASLQPKLYAKDDPELSVEAQLSRFVREKLDSCLSNYDAFREQGFVIEVGDEEKAGEGIEKEVTATVGEESVSFRLKMPVKVSKGAAEAELEQFYVKVPLRLKHYYAIADKIAQAEREQNFLESQALNLIDMFSSLEPGKLPPTEAVSFDLIGTHFWAVDDVKAKLKSLLVSYVPLLRMYGSHNVYYYDYPTSDLSKLYQQQYNEMIIPLTGAEDVEVRFDYVGWEPYFDVNDVNGIIKSQDVFVAPQWGITPAFGSQRYSTVYDLSHPVLVTVDDPAALDGQGYQFFFALESNIRNNDRVRDAEILPPSITAFRESIACQENQRTTELVKAVVVDSFTKEPLELVRVGFTIPDQDECTLGMTDEEGTFEGKFPPVYGGQVNFIKEDYLTNFYPIDTYASKDEQSILGYAVAGLEQPVIEMHKFKSIPVSVKKKKVGKCLVPLECDYTLGILSPLLPIPYKDITCRKGERQCFFEHGAFELPEPVATFEAVGSLSAYNEYYFLGGEASPLAEDEQVQVTLTKVGDIDVQSLGDEYSATFDVTGQQNAEVRLVPGIYKVNAMLRQEQPIIIPADGRSIKFSILGYDPEDTFSIEGSTMDSYLAGMIQWDTDKTYLTITPEQLYGSKALELYIPAQDLQSVPESVKVKENECGGIGCLPGVGCLGDGCVAKTISISGRVIEDTQMMGFMTNVSRMPEVRAGLEPRFT